MKVKITKNSVTMHGTKAELISRWLAIAKEARFYSESSKSIPLQKSWRMKAICFEDCANELEMFVERKK